MSHKAVFPSLKEAFPQVDIRILKATAIEHYKDADAAANFILAEVLPHLTEPVELHYSLDDSRKGKTTLLDADSSKLDPFLKDGFGESQVDLLTGSRTLECNIGCNSDSVVEYFTESNEKNFQLTQQQVVELEECFTADKSHTEIEPETISSNHPTACEEPSFFKTNLHPMKYADSEGQGVGATFDGHENSSQYDLENDDQVLVTISNMEVVADNHHPATIAIQSGKVLNVDVAESVCHSSYYGDSAIMLSPPSFLKTNTGSEEHGLAEEKNTGRYSAEHEEPSQHFLENDNGDLISKSAISVNEEHCSMTAGSRSDQILNVDVLEDIINDAKSSKNTLMSAMESVVSLVKEAELHEEEALQAREESSKAGLDIIAKTEDLKKKLIHARETNDMHAGELYGEKSILAAEARELQFRLLSLADDRDRTLSMIEEMRMILEARIAAAEAESMAAEEERLSKKEEALKVFKEQENIMDKTVEESQRLQQQEEENSKLREFLVDRGRIVDTLQGEIAVICEDVMSLKETVDGHVPFNKFLRSKPTSLTSSTTSCRSTMTARVPEPMELSDDSKTMSEELRGSQDVADDLNMGTVAAGDRNIDSSDNEWQFFDDAVVFKN